MPTETEIDFKPFLSRNDIIWKNYFALATFFFYKQDTKKVARAGKGSGESGTFV